jgi:quinol-cytochrome oxidoreductase complex cytochrome b subunit
MSRFLGWLHERVPVDPETLRKPLREELPIHLKTWLACLGGTPLLMFCILATTGILLTFYYVPDPSHAYESIQNITFHVRFGWFIRGVHRGAAQLMIITMLLHMIRVFGTRAYRKPREMNWMLGVALFMTVMGFAFTGYSLVNDQLSYWATIVGTNMVGTMPLLGKPMLYLLRGGPEVNPNTMSRFYDIHIGILPTIITLLIAGHIILVRMHGVARLENDPRTETYAFFPDHFLREMVVGLLALIVLVNYAIFFPPTTGSPANPLVTPAVIRPEWYFWPVFRWLELVPEMVGLGGVLLFVLGMFFWPFIDVGLEKVAPKWHLGRIVGTTAFLITLGLLLWEAIAG